jgi:hypothetical protein
MAVRTDSEPRGGDNRRRNLLGQFSRGDLLLAAIPLAFAIPLLCHVLLPIPFHVAVGAGALTSAVLVADGLFVNPPINPPQGSSQ